MDTEIEESVTETEAASEMLPALTFSGQNQNAVEDNQTQTLCLKCDKKYRIPVEQDDYLAHLFMEHRLIIADVEEVVLLDEYLKYWQEEFKDKELQEYCTTMLLDQLPNGMPAKNERYYLLSNVLPKDYELRQRLQQQVLENALARHQFERTDRSFSKECLYCRNIISGSRAEFLEHLYNKHFLQLGKPENLVYVDDLIAKVQKNLDDLVCLFCEKVFKDRTTLKEHMRKKAHKRINPNNRAYDKHFLINYRDERLGKQVTPQQRAPRRLKPKLLPIQGPIGSHTESVTKYNHTTTAEAIGDDSSQMATTEGSVDFERRFGRNNSNSEDSDWSDWDESGSLPLICLYCAHQETDLTALKVHMLAKHKVDFDAATKSLHFYQRIKVVNYVRRQMRLLRCVKCNVRCETEQLLLDHLDGEGHYGVGAPKQWERPEYFFPTYEDDGLLCSLDDNRNDADDQDKEESEASVRVIPEDTVAQINKDAERLSLENYDSF